MGTLLRSIWIISKCYWDVLHISVSDKFDIDLIVIFRPFKNKNIFLSGKNFLFLNFGPILPAYLYIIIICYTLLIGKLYTI